MTSPNPLLPSLIGPSAGLRMVCLPYAGGGTADYHRWRKYIPDDIQILPLRLPGREDRFSERSYSNLLELARDGTDAILESGGSPLVLVGHSLGAYIALEIARELRRRRAMLPLAMIVSAAPAPHLARRDSPLSQLPNEEFVAELVRRYDGIPTPVLANRELLEQLLPALRADIGMLESYCAPEEPPFDLEILALGGTADPSVSMSDLLAWQNYTTGRFSCRLFSGGHFFLFRDRAEGTTSSPNSNALQTIVHRLRKLQAGA